MLIIKTYHHGRIEQMTLDRALLELTLLFPDRLIRSELDAGQSITTEWATYKKG
jgi:hypothetical protein